MSSREKRPCPSGGLSRASNREGVKLIGASSLEHVVNIPLSCNRQGQGAREDPGSSEGVCDEHAILKTAGYSRSVWEGFLVGVTGHSGVSLNTFGRLRPSAMT